MKILFVNDYATPAGGAEVGMQILRDGLRQRGHEVRILASSAGVAEQESLADYECFGTTGRFRTLLQTANPWAYRRLRQALDDFRPDVVHVKIFLTQLSPLILPLLGDVPSLYHVVWYRPVCPTGFKLLPDGTMCQVSAGAACYHNRCLPLRDWAPLMLQMKWWRQRRDVFDVFVANSEATRRYLLAEGIGPVEVVWNGVPVRPSRPRLTAPPTAAFAGRLVWEKGADVLLRAFARVVADLPDARLLVTGDGPERERLDRLAIQLGLASNVSMLGHVPHEALERTLDAAWVQVAPSRAAEPFSFVAIEAMMRGTAVIASRAGGLVEIVRPEKTGWLVPPGDDVALAEAMLRILQDRALAEAMGQAGREVALAQFHQDVYVDRFIQLYQNLLRGNHP